MTLRLATRSIDTSDGSGNSNSSNSSNSSSSSSSSSIGITFDHALTDVGGAALFLAHISAIYCEQPPPPSQTTSAARSRTSSRGSASTRCRPLKARMKHKVEGGVALEWSYSSAELAELKDPVGARTRHDALFADVVVLLREGACWS